MNHKKRKQILCEQVQCVKTENKSKRVVMQNKTKQINMKLLTLNHGIKFLFTNNNKWCLLCLVYLISLFSLTPFKSVTDCPMSEWSEWTVCSCVSQWQQRYRVPLSLATRGQLCTEIEKQSRACKPQDCQGEVTAVCVCVWVFFKLKVNKTFPCFLTLCPI